jgi:hypothetical protein
MFKIEYLKDTGKLKVSLFGIITKVFFLKDNQIKFMGINLKKQGNYLFVFNNKIPTNNKELGKYITIHNVNEEKNNAIHLKDVSFKMNFQRFNLSLKDYGSIELTSFKTRKINIVKELGKKSILQPDFTNILPSDVEHVDSINYIFEKKTILGQYDEVRTLYDGRKLYHQGIDVFWNLGTAISFPFTFQILGVYSSFEESNSVGGVIIGRIHKDQYSKLFVKKIDNDYLDFQLFHLNNNIIDTLYSSFVKEKVKLEKTEYWKILLKEPLFIKKNESFAFIGSYKDNGGWPSHLHLQFIKNKTSNGLPWNNGADFQKADLNNYNPVSLLGIDISDEKKSMVFKDGKFICQENVNL